MIDGKHAIEVQLPMPRIIDAATGEPIPPDEPVLLLRASDLLVLNAVDKYYEDCKHAIEDWDLEGLKYLEWLKEKREAFYKFLLHYPGRVHRPYPVRDYTETSQG